MLLATISHVFHDIWHFLYTQGLIRAAVGWGVGYTMAHVIGLPRAWRKHMRIQDVIADRLDTETPGGLGDIVMDEVKKVNQTSHISHTSHK